MTRTAFAALTLLVAAHSALAQGKPKPTNPRPAATRPKAVAPVSKTLYGYTRATRGRTVTLIYRTASATDSVRKALERIDPAGDSLLVIGMQVNSNATLKKTLVLYSNAPVRGGLPLRYTEPGVYCKVTDPSASEPRYVVVKGETDVRQAIAWVDSIRPDPAAINTLYEAQRTHGLIEAGSWVTKGSDTFSYFATTARGSVPPPSRYQARLSNVGGGAEVIFNDIKSNETVNTVMTVNSVAGADQFLKRYHGEGLYGIVLREGRYPVSCTWEDAVD